MSAPYASAAADYQRGGWSPLPLPARTKFPPPTGWTGYDAPAPSGADVHEWATNGHGAGNIALRMPESVLGLDVDAYGGKPGASTLSDAVARLGGLPPTWVSTSRDDGISGIRFYRVPAGRCWADVLGPGVEIIHHGHRYAVAAPSVHPEGRPYSWRAVPAGGQALSPAVDDLPALPVGWVDELDRGPVDDRATKADIGDRGAAAFVAAFGEGEPCAYVARLLGEAEAALSGAASRHDTVRTYVGRIVRAGEQGHHGAAAGLDTLEGVYLAALKRGAIRDADRGEWARLVGGAVALAKASPTPEGDKGCCAAIPDLAMPPTGAETNALDEFWGAREHLALIRQWARARMAAPPAVLGAVLARVIAAVPPFVVLPPIIGGEASLNLYCALVGPSGGGKGAADRSADAGVDLSAGMPFTEAGAGSGEGLAHLYARRVKTEVEYHTQSVLLSVPEVDTLAGLQYRQGSTLLPELRKGWIGEALGFAYADPLKRLPIPAHRYRLCMLLGVQPARAGVLLDDTGGGTPQRFLWLPTADPAAPDVPPDAPERIGWRMPRSWGTAHNGVASLEVCGEAVDTVRAARLARLRGDGEALDGHALLNRLKVGAGLGILDGRPEVSAEDWRLAGLVLAQSAHTRAAVVAELARTAKDAGTARALEDGRREVIRGQVTEGAEVQRACKAIVRKLRREGGWVAGNTARRAIASPLRPRYDDAVVKLADAGQIEVDDTDRGDTGHGGRGVRLRLAEGVE